MSDEQEEPPEPAPRGRSRYEDYDIEVPQPTAAPGTRTPTLTVAAVVLLLSGLLTVLGVLAFGVGGVEAAWRVVLGVAEVLGAVLVFMRYPVGRTLGYVLGAIGIVIGIVTARNSPANGLVTIGLNGYVIYALAVSGPSFRRG
jgi:hypothetical protein